MATKRSGSGLMDPPPPAKRAKREELEKHIVQSVEKAKEAQVFLCSLLAREAPHNPQYRKLAIWAFEAGFRIDIFVLGSSIQDLYFGRRIRSVLPSFASVIDLNHTSSVGGDGTSASVGKQMHSTENRSGVYPSLAVTICKRCVAG